MLPLARIAIEVDLLDAITKGKTDLKLEDVTVSLISIFELQTKAMRLMVPAEFIIKAVKAIFNAFKVEPFYTLVQCKAFESKCKQQSKLEGKIPQKIKAKNRLIPIKIKSSEDLILRFH